MVSAANGWIVVLMELQHQPGYRQLGLPSDVVSTYDTLLSVLRAVAAMLWHLRALTQCR